MFESKRYEKSSICSWIKRLARLRRVGDLLHNPVPLMLLEHAFDSRDDMLRARRDEEVGRLRPDSFIFGDRQLNGFRASLEHAFADPVWHRRINPRMRSVPRFHTLVELAEAGLISSRPLLQLGKLT
jgi:hypothetical protein